MPDGGILTINAENKTVKADPAITDGNYAKISIKDQGHGISRQHLSKIFDPYFTTKQTGSGLGLATAFSVVTNHNGYIFVESELGQGTTFSIYLPVSKQQAAKKHKKIKKIVAGQGKILVMDDEEIVREVCQAMLKTLGYEVCCVNDGAQAIEAYKKAVKFGQPFDAVILDLTVPGGMGGKEAISNLARLDPDVKAVASSGYSVDSIMAAARKHGFKNIIAKPYDLERLAAIIHKTLEKG